MEQVSLSDIELYYSPEKIYSNSVIITGEECHHIRDVMRHKINDEIYVTNGIGSIFKVGIDVIDKYEITCSIFEEKNYANKFEKIIFCIPRLKSAERFEFALEKCVELGITNFTVFESARTIAKGDKTDKWQKHLIAAMKQSLRAWLPKISYVKRLDKLLNIEGEKIIFDQSAEQSFQDYLSTNNKQLTTDSFFIFGPEGGLTSGERTSVSEECRVVKLTENRLRSETAIVTAAAILNNSNL